MHLFLALLWCAIFIVLASCSQGKVEVVVWNAGADALDNVQLEWEGETVEIGNLAAGSTAKRVIHPHAENALTLMYHRERSGQFVCRNEAYFDSNWRGVIHVRLVADDNAEFSWTDRKGDSSAVSVACTRKSLGSRRNIHSFKAECDLENIAFALIRGGQNETYY